MPLQARQVTILDVVGDTEGDPFVVGRKSDRHLFVVTIAGAAAHVAVEARQDGGPWRELGSTDVDAEVNVDDYGWHEFRAVSSGMAPGATATVVWSWN